MTYVVFFFLVFFGGFFFLHSQEAHTGRGQVSLKPTFEGAQTIASISFVASHISQAYFAYRVYKTILIIPSHVSVLQ